MRSISLPHDGCDGDTLYEIEVHDENRSSWICPRCARLADGPEGPVKPLPTPEQRARTMRRFFEWLDAHPEANWKQ
jgi:hypothetical protein